MVKLAAAGCALVFLAGCGAVPSSDAAPAPQPLSASASSTGSASSGEPAARPSGRRTLGNGLAITVSAPKVFTPTAAAYPRTARAVAFELTIDNLGTDPYRPSQLSVTATSNGAAALQVIDSTQGYTGFLGTDDEVPPGQHIRIPVAFAVPAERAEVDLVVQANATDGGGVTVFHGTV